MEKRLYKHLEITDLKDMLNKTNKLYGDRPAYKIKIAQGKYKIYTHAETRKIVNNLGTALCSLGLKGKRIAVIGENRFEWEIAYLSIVCGTGIVVPLDKSLPENELEMLIERSNIEAIFFSKKYTEVIEKIKISKTNKLKHLISMDLEKHTNGIYSQNELIQYGEILEKEGNTEFINSTINPEEMSIMLFTSGTTSVSKVVALSHKNICSNLMDIGSVLDVNCEDTILSILPIHHVFECTVGFLFSLYKGAQTVFCDGIRHIVENLKEYKVSVMANVPGIYERIFMIIRKDLEKQGKLEKILEEEEKYKDFPMEKRKEIFKEIHDMLGGRVKLFISGAAALDYKIEEKYRLLGINLVQGYGLTETSPVICVHDRSEKGRKIGTVGRPIKGVEVKLVPETNELLCRGHNVMKGYYKAPDLTAEAIEADGWFHTGDTATIDENGHITITGRIKSIFKTSMGKYINPFLIEEKMAQSPFIDNIMVVGENQKFAAAIISPNAQYLKSWAQIHKIEFKTIEDLVKNPEVIARLRKEVNKYNVELGDYEKIKKFDIVPDEWSQKNGLLTPTLKVKRNKAIEFYKENIDKLFA